MKYRKCIRKRFGVRGQFDFVWLFAILAGGAILFLAIWGALKIGDTERYKTDTEVAKTISIITDPLQAGFADGSFGSITFKQETKLNNDCSSEGQFGKNIISVATRSNIGDEWNFPGGAISIYNKYLFSDNSATGNVFYVFSKPFYFPYEISDLIFITVEDYCFIDAPNEIADEILNMKIPNFFVENCTEKSLKVCFGTEKDCDIQVSGSCTGECDTKYDEGKVSKNGHELEYTGNLMYAAIFSDEEIYACNVKRLMNRASIIADVLVEKTDLMDSRQCNTNLKSDLIFWSVATFEKTAGDLSSLNVLAKEMNSKNKKELCGVWD